jgi:aspartate carbamoyltransferase catalytic subunit
LKEELSDFKGRDILTTQDLDRNKLECIYNVADRMYSIVRNRTKIDLLSDKIMASLFFQPSTRTRLSFESAMQRLSGSVIGWADPKVSRAGDAFQETIEDTARMIDLYADIAVIRHFQAGAPARFAEFASIPVINGGDGHGAQAEHPTQAIGDIYTILKEKGHIDGLSIALAGDLTGRVQHSLGYALANYDVKVYVVSPPDLALPNEVESTFRKMGLNFEQRATISEIIHELDVIHLTGIRSTSIHTSGVMGEEKTADEFSLSLNKMKDAKKDLMVLHPLPRIDELSADLDNTQHNKYFLEALNGLIVRMALICLVLGKSL